MWVCVSHSRTLLGTDEYVKYDHISILKLYIYIHISNSNDNTHTYITSKTFWCVLLPIATHCSSYLFLCKKPHQNQELILSWRFCELTGVTSQKSVGSVGWLSPGFSHCCSWMTDGAGSSECSIEMDIYIRWLLHSNT